MYNALALNYLQKYNCYYAQWGIIREVSKKLGRWQNQACAIFCTLQQILLASAK